VQLIGLTSEKLFGTSPLNEVVQPPEVWTESMHTRAKFLARTHAINRQLLILDSFEKLCPKHAYAVRRAFDLYALIRTWTPSIQPVFQLAENPFSSLSLPETKKEEEKKKKKKQAHEVQSETATVMEAEAEAQAEHKFFRELVPPNIYPELAPPKKLTKKQKQRKKHTAEPSTLTQKQIDRIWELMNETEVKHQQRATGCMIAPLKPPGDAPTPYVHGLFSEEKLVEPVLDRHLILLYEKGQMELLFKINPSDPIKLEVPVPANTTAYYSLLCSTLDPLMHRGLSEFADWAVRAKIMQHPLVTKLLHQNEAKLVPESARPMFLLMLLTMYASHRALAKRYLADLNAWRPIRSLSVFDSAVENACYQIQMELLADAALAVDPLSFLTPQQQDLIRTSPHKIEMFHVSEKGGVKLREKVAVLDHKATKAKAATKAPSTARRPAHRPRNKHVPVIDITVHDSRVPLSQAEHVPFLVPWSYPTLAETAFQSLVLDQASEQKIGFLRRVRDLPFFLQMKRIDAIVECVRSMPNGARMLHEAAASFQSLYEVMHRSMHPTVAGSAVVMHMINALTCTFITLN
jgi:hypothetical protein